MAAPSPLFPLPDSHPVPVDGLEPEARINFWLIGWTLAIVLTLAVAAWFLRLHFLRMQSTASLEKARQAEREGDRDKALTLYQQHLQASQSAGRQQTADVKRRAELLGQMAHLLRSTPATPAANRKIYETYEESLRLDRDQPSRRREFIQWLMQIGRYQDALSHLKVWQETVTSELDAGEAAFLSAVCLESTQRYQESQAEFLASIRHWPRQTVSYVHLAQLWTSRIDDLDPPAPGDFPGAGEWVRVKTLLREGTSLELSRGWRATEALLEVMLSQGPEPEAVIDAAQFLISQPDDLDRVPNQAEKTDTEVRAAVDQSDLPPSAVPSQTSAPSTPSIDRWSPRSPSFSDTDRDGRVTVQEIARAFASSSTWNRLNWTEQLVTGAMVKADAAQARELQVRLAQVYQAKAEASRFARPTEVTELLRQARDALNASATAEEANHIDFLTARFDLDLMELTSGAFENNLPLESLQKSEQDVLAILERLRELRGAPDSASQQDWTVTSRVPDLRRIEIEMRFRLAELLLSQCRHVNPDATETLLGRVDQEVASLKYLSAPSQFVDYLGLRRLIVEKEFAKAVQQVHRLSADLSATSPLARQVTLLAIECEKQTGTPDGCLKLLRQHLLQDPGWMTARQNLAESLLQQGRLDEAIAVYRPAAGSPVIGKRLLELLLARNADLPPRQRNWQESESLLKFLERQSGASIDVGLLKIELEMLAAVTLHAISQETRNPRSQRLAVEQLAHVEQQLRTLCTMHPASLAAHTLRISFALQRFDHSPDDRVLHADSLIANARQAFGEQLELDLLEAGVAVRRSGASASERLRELADARHDAPAEVRVRLLSGLARLATQAGDLQTAITFWQAVAKLKPADLESRLAVAQLLLQSEPANEGTWTEVLQEIARIEGTQEETVACLRAERIVRSGGKSGRREDELDAARQLLEVVELRRPEWPAVPRLRGLIEDLQGDPESAIKFYLKAVELGDRTSDLVRRLALYYYSRRDYKAADNLLLLVGGENARLLSSDLARISWRASWNRQQYDQALGVIQQLADDSRSGVDYIALALLQFARGGEGETTESVLRKGAFELNSRLPEPWMALVAYLARTHQWVKAENAISAARDHLPMSPRPTALLVTGSLYELLAAEDPPRQSDYRSAARNAFEQALEQASEDNAVVSLVAEHLVRTDAPERAEPLLQSLLNPARTAAPPVRRWARRQLAEILANRGTHQDTRQALDLLQTNVNEDQPLREVDLRLRLQLLNRLAAWETRAERIDALRRLQSLSALTPDDHLELARLLESGGDAGNARQELIALLKAFPDFALARSAYVRNLLAAARGDSKSLEEAAQQIEILRQHEPHSWQTAQLRVRLLAQSGQRERASDTLKEFLQARFEGNPERWMRTGLEQENLQLVLSELQRDRRVQASPAYQDAVTAGIRLLQAGQRDAAIESLLTGAVGSYLAELQFDAILNAALLSEELHLPNAESLFAEYSSRSPLANAPLALAGYQIRHGNVAEGLQLCETHWDRVSRSGAGSLIVLAARQLPMDQRDSLGVWRERLATARDHVGAAERAMLLVQLADLDSLTGNAAAAIAAYRTAVVDNPRNVAAFNNLAVLLAQHAERPEDLQEAERAIETALRIAGPVPGLVDTQAIVYLAQKRPAEALTILQPLASTQASPIIDLRIAECLLALGLRVEARQAVDSASRKGFSLNEIPPGDRPRLKRLVQETGVEGGF